MAERKANVQDVSEALAGQGADKWRPTTSGDADQLEYLADMILELQRIAARAGHHALAQRLLSAHELAARPAGR